MSGIESIRAPCGREVERIDRYLTSKFCATDDWGCRSRCGGSYAFSDSLSVTTGVENLFDKRLYREGNAQEAGAYTYNEPGRTFFVSVNTSF